MENIKLPETLTNNLKFNELFALKPKENNDVLVFNKETKQFDKKTIFRSYISYLKTPNFDPSTEKSYMFLNKEKEVPSQLKPVLDYVQNIDPRYNQMVVNWYNEEDYIEMHRDCTAKMLEKESPVLILNINETSDERKSRKMIFEDVKTKEKSYCLLKNNYLYKITNNTTHRHGVGKGLEKRISITFRMMK